MKNGINSKGNSTQTLELNSEGGSMKTEELNEGRG